MSNSDSEARIATTQEVADFFDKMQKFIVANNPDGLFAMTLAVTNLNGEGSVHSMCGPADLRCEAYSLCMLTIANRLYRERMSSGVSYELLRDDDNDSGSVH